jgi:hypothetical protein
MITASDLRNPYRMTVVPDAWQRGDADVPAIHAPVFQLCTRALAAVCAEGRNHGLLILGEPGSGKTHLLSRLRRYCLGDGDKPVDPILPEVAFVAVKLAAGPQQIWRTLRREFVGDLMRPGLDDRPQLQRILLHRFAELRPADADLALWWEWLRQLDPQPAAFESILDNLLDRLSAQERLGRDVTVVLGHLILNRQGRDALAWLRGDPLPESALAALGLGLPDPDVAPEDQAREVVTALCRLAGPKIPIVFAFDQIEALQLERHDTTGFFALGQLLMDLFSRASNLLLISCVQSGRIKEVEEGMTQPAYERMAMYQAALNPLLWREAEALIRARDRTLPELEARRQANGSPPLWPLDLAALENAVGQQGLSARKLLNACAQMFDGERGEVPPPPPVENYLSEHFARRREEALAHVGFERSREVVGSTLPHLVSVFGRGTWRRVTEPVPGLRPGDVDGVWAGSDGRVAVHVCDALDMRSAWRPLERLKHAVDDGQLEKVVLIRDAREPLRGDATTRNLQALRDRGATYIRPTAELLAALDALRSLLADAQSGDLSRDGESISVATVQEWLERHVPAQIRELVDQVFAYPRPDSGESDERDSEALADRVAEQLGECPVLALDALVEQLAVSADLLERCLEGYADRFGTLAGPPRVVFRRVDVGVAEPEDVAEPAASG